MLRPTLLAVLLLLAPLVAAGADSSETNAAGFRGAANHLAHQLDAWWAAGSGRAEASALPQEQQQLEETGMLRVRLQLPGDRSVVVGEGSTLEELVASLLEEQVGLAGGLCGCWSSTLNPRCLAEAQALRLQSQAAHMPTRVSPARPPPACPPHPTHSCVGRPAPHQH